MFSFQLFFHQKYSVRARDISLTYVTVTIKRRLNFVVMENEKSNETDFITQINSVNLS